MFMRNGLRILVLACIASVGISVPSLAQGFDPSNAQAVAQATGNAAATAGDVAATGAGAGIILTGTAVALGALKRSTSSPDGGSNKSGPVPAGANPDAHRRWVQAEQALAVAARRKDTDPVTYRMRAQEAAMARARMRN